MKNKLHYSVLLCITITGVLLLLYLLGEFNIGPFQIKKIDLLSDIRATPGSDSIFTAADPFKDTVAKPSHNDSLVAKQDSTLQNNAQQCPPLLTCIEDYSPGHNALEHFERALLQTQRSGTPLRIAFYGDSFIEGDVFCGSFRDTLQLVFGGRGVGYVPITSNVTGFRNTIRHRFDHWETLSLLEKNTVEIGPAGFTFIPQTNNWVEYRPSRMKRLREFNTIKLYYKNTGSAMLHYKIDTIEAIDVLRTSHRVEEWTYKRRNIKHVEFSFYPYDSLHLYGASFESTGGVYVDNFSIRGNSGLNLLKITPQMYKAFDRYRNYKLIILQFGLNLVVEENLNYEAYVKRMVTVIRRLKSIFPAASILLLSVSDRSVNDNGVFKTMPAIPRMRNAQRIIAQEAEIAFWDMYAAMGGKNSMARYVNTTPPLGARDYTHLTFRGGRKLGTALAKSLIFEQKKYEKALSDE